jgi:hypothetical protein
MADKGKKPVGGFDLVLKHVSVVPAGQENL